MKKLVLTAAVLGFAASIASAQVYSQNIVGYSKKSLIAEKFEIISAQFLASETNGISLGNALSGIEDQDQVLFWNGAGYDVYTYWAGYGWYDASATVESDDVLIPQGSSVWVKSSAGSDLTVAGEVTSADSVTNTLSAGFNMVASPYPVAMKLSDLPVNALSDQDQAIIWNGAGYDSYTYWAGYGWYDASATVESDDVTVPVGGGFWLSSAAGGQIVFNKSF